MNKTSKKILVTGAAGFLGSHLAEQLSKMNHNVIGVDNMIGGYKDNIPKNIEFFELDCCNLKKMNQVMKNVNIVYGSTVGRPHEMKIYPYSVVDYSALDNNYSTLGNT